MRRDLVSDLLLGKQWRILQGDVRDVLAGMDDQSVHCCITSPPYFGLRDYGLPPLLWGGSDECEHSWEYQERMVETWDKAKLDCSFATSQPKRGNSDAWQKTDIGSSFCRLCGCWRGSLGLEPCVGDYIQHLVEIFREVKRVLRDDGTLWLNLAGSFQEKQWVAAPWLLGLALQKDGWYLRSPIIWAKGLSFCETYSGSVMPESVRDRPTTSYEYLLLLTKSKRYFYDQDAVRENYARKYDVGMSAGIQWRDDTLRKAHETDTGLLRGGTGHAGLAKTVPSAGRNLRNVWVINPEPLRQKHFAAYPSKLMEPCIKAGTSERGCCPECGKGWERVVAKEQVDYGMGLADTHEQKRVVLHGDAKVRYRSPTGHTLTKTTTRTVGWRPGCDCLLYGEEGEISPYPQVPCTVLDPFCGSGTTVMVALRLGRRAIGIDLSEEYCRMACKRIIEDNPMFNTLGATP